MMRPAEREKDRPVLDKDKPLHEDMRWIAQELGAVVRHIEGEQVFQAVENLRVQCRDRRREQPDAPTLSEIVAEVDKIDLGVAARGVAERHACHERQ